MFSKMKYYFMVFILTVFAPSFAAADNIDQEDLTFIFGDMTEEQTLEAGQLELLSSQVMIATEGEFVPLFWVGYIGGVVAVDFALQSYFYGTYIPSITGR